MTENDINDFAFKAFKMRKKRQYTEYGSMHFSSHISHNIGVMWSVANWNVLILKSPSWYVNLSFTRKKCNVTSKQATV